MKFHKNSSSISSADIWMDMRKLTDAFCGDANAPKQKHKNTAISNY
jgi:hypothetical protein